MAINLYQYLPLQDPPKFTQIGIFGLKIYHLATLINTFSRKAIAASHYRRQPPKKLLKNKLD
jgi:hypothetical protein